MDVSIFLGYIDAILFKHAGNEDMHDILYDFENWPDPTTDRSKLPFSVFITLHLLMRKMVSQIFSVFFSPIILILAGKKEMQKVLDKRKRMPGTEVIGTQIQPTKEFEFRQTNNH